MHSVALFQFNLCALIDTTQTFSFTPPSACPGPWEKVVFDVDFSENAGRQFERTATILSRQHQPYFGATPAPLQTVTDTWHIERDVTDYSALLASPQTGTMVLGNCPTDCPPPFNTELNGVFTVNAQPEFYPAGEHRNFTVLDQLTSMQSTVSATTTTSNDFGSVVVRDDFSFPISVDFIFPVAPPALVSPWQPRRNTNKL